MMDSYKKMYQQWVEEDLSYIDELITDIIFYENLYKKNIFTPNFPKYIKDRINELKKQTDEQLNECQLNINSLKDRINLAKDFIAQSEENRRYVIKEREEAGNSSLNVA